MMDRITKPESRRILTGYGLALLVSLATVALTVWLEAHLERTTFGFFYLATLLVAWYAGLGPMLLVVAFGAVAGGYLMFTPPVAVGSGIDLVLNLGLFLGVSLIIGIITSARERASRALDEQREELQVTLSSIGDAVIVCDSQSRVQFLNHVAEAICGWTAQEASGRPLLEVFKIVNEENGELIEDPTTRVLKEGRVIGLGNHTALITRSGAKRPIEDSAAPIQDRKGRITGVVLIFRDITDRRLAEQALAEQENRYRGLIENSADAIILVDRGGRIRYASASISRVTGYKPDELIGKDALDYLHPDDRAALSGTIDNIVTSPGLAAPARFRLLHKDGSYRWMEGMGRNSLEEASLKGIVVNFRDVTDRVNAADELRESRDQLDAILRGVTEGITVQAKDGKIVFANENAIRQIGLKSIEDLINSPSGSVASSFEMLDEAGQPFPAEHLPGRLALEGKPSARTVIRFRPLSGGEERWALVEAAPVMAADGTPQYAVSIFRDVTQQKESEKRAAAQYATTRILAESSSLKEAAPQLIQALGENLGWDAALLWTPDRDSEKLRLLSSWYGPRIQPREFEELSRRTLFAKGVGFPGTVLATGSAVWLPDYAGSRYLRSPEASRAGLQTSFGIPILLGTQVLGILELLSRYRREPDPELTMLVVSLGAQVAQFVERKQAEDALRDSEDRMRAIAETASDGIITIDSNSQILFVNGAVTRIFGYKSDELIGRPLTHLMPREAREVHFAALKRYVHTGQKRLNWAAAEMTGRRKNGDTFPLEVSIGEFVKEGKHFFTGIVRDVRERQEIEERLRFQADILNNVRDSVAVADPQGRILYWNAGSTDLFGYSEADMRGQSLARIYPDQSEARLLDDIQMIVQGQEYNGPWVGRRKDGQELWIEVKRTPIRSTTGRVIGILSVSKDISERIGTERALRASEERFRSLSASSPIGIFLADIAGKITYANPTLLALAGIGDPAQFDRLDTAIHPDDSRRIAEAWAAYTHEGAPYDVEYRIVVRDAVRWVHARSSPMLSDRDALIGHVGTVEDITRSRQSSQALEYLAEASRVLSTSLDFETTLKSIAQLTVPRLADWCVVDMLGEDGILHALETVHSNPDKVHWAEELRERYPIDMNAPIGAPNVVRTGKAELYPEITEAMLQAAAHNEEELEILHQVGYRSVMVVPLVARGTVAGAISYVAAESGRHFDEADLAVAEELARRAATAIENASLYRAEQGARHAAEQASERTMRLQAVTASLSSTLAAVDVATAAVNQGVAAVGASAGYIALLEPDSQRLRVAASVGYGQVPRGSDDALPDSSLPMADAVRSGKPVWLTSRAERLKRYPDLAANRPANSFNAFLALPLTAQGRVIGGLGLSFAHDITLREADRDLILTMTEQASQAFERARLFEAERESRSAADRARDRISLLAESSQSLAKTLDFEVILKSLADLAVPSLADWCTIDVLDEDGQIHMAARKHVNPDKTLLIDELNERFPLQPDAPYGYPYVIRTGEASFLADPTPADVETIASEPDHVRLIQDLGFSSHICVPLAARGRSLGSITLNLSQRGHCYSLDDLALSQEFARRGAVALDNARLYTEAQAAVAARDQFLSIASHELKTPLTSLVGYTELLRRSNEHNSFLTERDRRALDTIASQSLRLDKLINSMLDLSRIQNGQLTVERGEVDLSKLAREAIQNGELITDRHTFELTGADQPVLALGDGMRLEQVLENLVHNAIKYSPNGGAVRVHLWQENGSVCASVADQGIGIPEQEIQKLFTRFYRVQNLETRHISGMGVGLYVVREIVRAHGGEISVTSRVGEGSTFSFCLPALP